MTEYTNTDLLDEVDNEELQEAKILKKRQSKIKKRYEFLSKVDDKHFAAEYVRIQANEICNYVRDLAITPLNALYNSMYSHFTNGNVMQQFYITLNEFGNLEPDNDRIDTLILLDKIEDYDETHPE